MRLLKIKKKNVVIHEHQFKRKGKYCKFYFDKKAYTKPKNFWSLRSKPEVLIWRHIIYVPKSSTTFLICVILDPVICKNNICHSGSSQVIQVYIPCLFYISPERISNTCYLFCVLHHWASFTRECHGTAILQTQTTSTYDVIGHR